MVSKLWCMAIALAMTGLLASGAAGEVDPDLQEMRETVDQLREQVERQQQQLDEQAEFLAGSETQVSDEEESGSGSGLSTFLEAAEVHAWINVNYTYNSRGNSNDHLIGQNSNTGFHEDSHTFQVDQLWFQIDKPVSSESRAGFHADIAFGETARSEIGFAGNDAVTVYSAYASFLAPMGYGGVRFDAGELWTLLGAEVVPVSENLNITRGMVWNLQPVTNTGAIATTNFGPVSVSFGLVNAVVSDTATDSDRDKALTGRIAFEAEKWSIAGSFIHGSKLGALEDSKTPLDPDEPDGPFFPVNKDRNKTDLGVFDLVVAGDPAENITAYLNFDYVWSHPGGAPNESTYGVAVAGRYGVSDVMGLSMRFEMVIIDPSNKESEEEYSLTTTVDYLITDNLTARGEMRFDWGIDGKYHKAGDPYAFTGGANHQNLFLAEVIYSF
ncbi:MAG: outer membrane beta-barrel protein [Deltaproteobacteria bacterium]|nr:outer membrane beta-barrel protein [Deltaproteobacteria bacterium]MBW2388609.1 outer membrane beta-barrel protein [Deltaproteobacteria bacterium]